MIKISKLKYYYTIYEQKQWILENIKVFFVENIKKVSTKNRWFGN